jgi:hypothetical protein
MDQCLIVGNVYVFLLMLTCHVSSSLLKRGEVRL